MKLISTVTTSYLKKGEEPTSDMLCVLIIPDTMDSVKGKAVPILNSVPCHKDVSCA
jgi:hypothetical protein